MQDFWMALVTIVAKLWTIYIYIVGLVRLKVPVR